MPKPPLPDEVAEFLSRPNYATISVVRPDGQPVSVPTWYLFEGGQVVVNMDAGRKRLDYLRRGPAGQPQRHGPRQLDHPRQRPGPGRRVRRRPRPRRHRPHRPALHGSAVLPCATAPASRPASTSTGGTAGAACETPGELAGRPRRAGHPAPLGRRRPRAGARPGPRHGARPRVADRAPALAHGGRTAEHVGASGVPWDTFARQVRLEPTVRASYEALDAETQAWLQAYVEGVDEGLPEGLGRAPARSRCSGSNPLWPSLARGSPGRLWASSGRSTCSSAPSPTSSSTVTSPTRSGPTCCPSSTPRASTAAKGSSSRAATRGSSAAGRRRRDCPSSPVTRTARSSCPAATSRSRSRARSSTSWASPSRGCRVCSTSRTPARSHGASRTPWRTTRT